MLQNALIIALFVLAGAGLTVPRILRRRNARPKLARIIELALGVALFAVYLTWSSQKPFATIADPLSFLAICWLILRIVPKKYLAAPLTLFLAYTSLRAAGRDRLIHLPSPYHALGDYYHSIMAAVIIAWLCCFVPFLIKSRQPVFGNPL